MKKLLATLLATLFVLTGLTACNSEPTTDKEKNSKPSNSQSVNTGDENNDVNLDTDNDNNGGTQTAPVPKPEPKPDVTPIIKNEFLNEGNNAYTPNEVTIQPYHIYWENGKLVACCYIINGLTVPVLNVQLDSLSFSNKQVPIASGSFGILNTGRIEPLSYITWKFTFSDNAIANANADLSTISTLFELKYLS